MLYTTDLNKAGHTGQNNFKDVIVKNEVRIQCNANIFNGFCGYRIIPQQRQTDVGEVGECFETSVQHELGLIWVHKKTIIEAPITNSEDITINIRD